MVVYDCNPRIPEAEARRQGHLCYTVKPHLKKLKQLRRTQTGSARQKQWSEGDFDSHMACQTEAME